MPTAAKTSTQKVTLRLDESLVDAYTERATRRARTVETEMQEALERSRTHTSSQPIYVTDAARVALSELANRPLTNEASLISWAQSLSSIKVGGIDIPLGEQLLKRLSTRTFGKTFEDYLRQSVIEQLESLVGMR